MPFDAGDFDWRGRPAPDHNHWEWLNNFLHRLALLLARAAFVGIVLLNMACAVAVLTGSRIASHII